MNAFLLTIGEVSGRERRRSWCSERDFRKYKLKQEKKISHSGGAYDGTPTQTRYLFLFSSSVPSVGYPVGRSQWYSIPRRTRTRRNQEGERCRRHCRCRILRCR